MKTIFKLVLLVSALWLIHACTADQNIVPADATSESQEIKIWNPKEGIKKFIPQEHLANIRPQDLDFIENELKGIKTLETRGEKIHIAAGSSNALSAAIAGAPNGAVIVLGSGDHTQSGTITIDKCIHIEGYGANLIFSNTTISPTFSFTAGFHFKKGGEVSSIRGLTFKGADTIPGLAVFIDRVDQIKILDNTFENWHSSIFMYDSDYSTIWKNKIHVNRGWMTGALSDGYGIVLSDGRQNLVIQNVVDGGLFGIWTGGAQGTDFHNTTTECLYGQILCKVPAGGFVANGTTVNTVNTTSNWLCNFNTSNNNLQAGYLVIDEAHHNIMEHNKASGNGLYDIELTGDSHRFGFLTPKSENNRVYAYYGQKVKDCGDHNQIYGGILVNNTTDPCN